MQTERLTNKEFLMLAVPFMISTLTQPLLGAVDTAVAGRLENASYIAGVVVASNIFNTLYWMFGFLRVSTTALSAQSLGQNSIHQSSIAFFRPIIMALLVSSFFLIFQNVIIESAIFLIRPDSEVQLIARTYYHYVIWGAPFVLCNYVILGWLMGQRRIKSSMTMQISGNVLNAILTILFALIYDFGIAGIAVATLISQIFSSVLGVLFMIYSRRLVKVGHAELLDKKAWIQAMRTNEYLMKRTACLLIHNNVFVAVGARFGTTLLAVNGVLFQMNAITSYMFDGLANAASVFAGKAKGSNNQQLLEDVAMMTRRWTRWLSVIIILFYALFQGRLFMIFTSFDNVLEGLATYSPWLFIYPIVAGMGLSIYGIFTGMGSTKAIFTTTFQSLIGFLLVIFIAVPIFDNHGLWLALITFYTLRSVLLLKHLKSHTML